MGADDRTALYRHRSDFAMPEVIDLILGRVGVDRGDGVKRRFP